MIPPKPEAVGPGEDAGEANARVIRDQAAVRRVTELNVEHRRKGPRITQNWFYHEAQETETLKDLFIGRIRDVDVQQQLIKAKTD